MRELLWMEMQGRAPAIGEFILFVEGRMPFRDEAELVRIFSQESRGDRLVRHHRNGIPIFQQKPEVLQ